MALLPTARRTLTELRDPIREQIFSALRELSEDPVPAESIAMRGKGLGLRRLRVGQYRVIYRIQAAQLIVLVIRIGHRRDIYRGFEPRHKK